MWYRNPGKWIRELFPNQTKNVPSILVWSMIFIVDLASVLWLTDFVGITMLQMQPQIRTFVILLCAIAAFALFFLEAKVWDRICSKIKK